MRPRELVIFDMDDMLCHYDLVRRLLALALLADVTARDVRAAACDKGFNAPANGAKNQGLEL